MSTRIRGALPLVGLLVLGASCATTQRSASEHANAADERSRQELRQAQEAQQKAADQEKNVAAARQDVVRSQQQLAQAQRKENEERAKLQQLQQQADLHARQAEAARAPAAAAAGQTVPPGGPVRSARQTISGHVLQARPNQLVLQARTGQTLTLDVNDQTQIYVGGERRSADELQQGADARVAYEETGGRPTALTVEVPRAAPPSATGTQQPGTRAPEPELPAQDTRATPVPGADNLPPAGTQ